MARELLITGRTQNLRDVESNNENKRSNWRDWTLILLWGVIGYSCIILTVLSYSNPGLIFFNVFSLLFRKEISPFFAFSQGTGHYSKPQGFKIVALVPFHHHERTAILDCYLQKNLVHNNGFLDQVVFVPQTDDTVSMEWLYSIVNQTPEYSISSHGHEMEWNVAKDNMMYIRIDGDIVFLEDNAISTIVKTKLDNPSTLMVSANVINEAALAFLHSHPGTALPYLPELYHVKQPSRSKSQLKHDWRASSLPRWQGPLNFKVHKDFEPPFEGHRWLLPRDAGSDRDPIARSVYTDTGPTLHDWTVGAQQHYSFLHHLEDNNLGRYKFPIWVDPTEPISENFGCFWGNDAVDLHRIFRNDHQNTSSHNWHMSDGSPPHVIIDGKGLVSYYSARQAVAGLDATDLITRYRAYAQEKVCLQTE
ncbi:uncharacterized protein N7479_004478 [Penicillium vulpinum]|uniref:Uncharacterized protein n=1 Tax=Penicillium vulpinum TaxID=29845 RepID=A0A1V6SC04_9EURO|nr:uncharacterized protein N7479_004478 [Penicillium vulpinum]KAJ5964602.1 hypothetical protein N7479_004478 [Penicillium vulpinum]OQE11522.1 hypothetical protein PENVUL_c002G03072 [Penicillium vulpinum]